MRFLLACREVGIAHNSLILVEVILIFLELGIILASSSIMPALVFRLFLLKVLGLLWTCIIGHHQ